MAKYNFTFIDLFAGIGGIRIPFQRLGGRCVFSSEWDEHAQITYEANLKRNLKAILQRSIQRIYLTTIYC